MSVLERLTCLFAPDDCLACGREGALLCKNCLTTLPVVSKRCFGCRTTTCGVACQACLREVGLRSLTAAAHYSGIAKALVGHLKFAGNQSAARLIAQSMGPLLPSEGVLVHMPATTAHVRERGYDQSRLLVRHLSRHSGLPIADVLRRSGNHHQLGADREQRLRQMHRALSVVRADLIRGRPVILIDDVLTTGSSLTAAALVLRRAGATRVDGLVFAQAFDDKKDQR